MNKEQVISNTTIYVKEKLEGEGSGHDWWHIDRVWHNAKNIGETEDIDMFVVELAALLHDISDWKFNNGDESVGPRIAGEWLESQGVDEETIRVIKEVIEDVSFKGAKVYKGVRSKEGEVVQDADRLDAIGAIGIARCFAYGGHKGMEIYNPDVNPVLHETAEDYKNNKSSSINHFYEKLLLLKDLMNTPTGRLIAEKRHAFMEEYLNHFYKECKGEE